MLARRDDILEMLGLESLGEATHPLFKDETPVNRFKRKQHFISQASCWSHNTSEVLRGNYREHDILKQNARVFNAEYVLHDHLLDMLGIGSLLTALRQSYLTRCEYYDSLNRTDGKSQWNVETITIWKHFSKAYSALLVKTNQIINDSTLRSQSPASICRLISEAADLITNEAISQMINFQETEITFVKDYLEHVKNRMFERRRNYLGRWYEEKDMKGVNARNITLTATAVASFLGVAVVSGMFLIRGVGGIFPEIGEFIPILAGDVGYVETGLCLVGSYLSYCALFNSTNFFDRRINDYNRYMQKNDPLISKLIKDSRMPSFKEYERAVGREYR
jgi:hypothetical protein